MSSVDFIVGNSYNEIPKSKAKKDKSGQYSKIHDWTLFLDIINGSPDIIERVQFDLGSSFSPSQFTCATPIQIKQKHNGKILWRFKTRQQTYGPISATVNIRGSGGTTQKVTHQTLLDKNSESLKAPVQQFVESRPMKPFRPMKLPDTQNFGIELELTSANTVHPDEIADMINRNNKLLCVDVIHNYGQGRNASSNWKIVPDSSIQCSLTSPDCNTFELVSPILTGGAGLSQIHKILTKLSARVQPKLKVNKSMGFHVHIDVSTYTHAQLVKICQNFIKYEDVIDTFMPFSRRTGSEESDNYFQSNRESIVKTLQDEQASFIDVSNSMCHDVLEERNSDIGSDRLCQLMNGDGRYYKLNMQNLVTGRQPTIEFRQHSATLNYDKVSAWIRFCVAFCSNSAKLASPKPFDENRSIDFKFDALFQYVIKDRALRDYYRGRSEELAREFDEGNGDCCYGCGSGGPCAKKRRL